MLLLGMTVWRCTYERRRNCITCCHGWLAYSVRQRLGFDAFGMERNSADGAHVVCHFWCRVLDRLVFWGSALMERLQNKLV